MIRVFQTLWDLLFFHADAPVVQCPYCTNPNRDSVYNNWEGCKWINPSPSNGSDPPCVCDDYGTDEQLSRLGLAR